MALDKRKQAWLDTAETEVLQNIVNTLGGPERQPGPSPEYPLGGLVHMSGLGQIPVSAIKAELASRKVTS